MSEEKKPERLMSLDALRGFDMWFISGGAGLIVALCKATNNSGCWLAKQMAHVPWEGIVQHDTIFPLFLFLAGVSWPFSYASRLAKGKTMAQIHLGILKRVITLYILGFLYTHAVFVRDGFRMMGVLQFIGLSWGLAALLYVHTSKLKTRLIWIALLLIGFWALLRFGIAPDAPAGAWSYAKEWNIVSYLDRTLWPTLLHRPGIYEPESLFSVTNGTALAFIGMMAGSILKSVSLAPTRKALMLFLCAIAAFAIDMVFIHLMGDVIVKALWTSSFVLSASTYGFAMLALFYWIIDVKGWRGWAFYFKIIGMNSIAVYMGQRIIGFNVAKEFFFGGIAKWFPAAWYGSVMSVGYLIVVWLFLYFLYKKNVFIRA